MTTPLRLAVVAGSTRSGSFSKQLARATVAVAKANGADATLVDLRDHEMPLYDGDLEVERGLPEGAVRLRSLLQSHDALLFSTPEYNASMSAVLKNAIDWLSRPYAKEPGTSPFRGKVAGVLASSPGALGGLRVLVHLRQVLMNVGMQVVTEQFALGGADKAFGADGALLDERHRDGVDKVVRSVLHVAGALAR